METGDIKVAGFVRNSFVDWPAKIAFVVFLGGCNFNCPHCHNHNLLGSISNRLPFLGVLDEIKEQIGFIDGVVLSGGEPTMHPHLYDIIAAVRGLGLDVKLDTNGSNFEILHDLVGRGLVNFVAMDIKAPIDKYIEYGFIARGDKAGILSNVVKSIEFLKSGVVNYQFRTTPVPELLPADLAAVKELAGAKWRLNDFVKPAKR
jgi:pyruvate formate lyase activating enzyme